MSALTYLRIAAGLHVFIAIGIGIFCFPAIRNVANGLPIPLVMGFPAYGDGPFERRGIATTVPLLVAFLAVCILEGVAGVLLWNGSMAGAVLALALLPVAGVFWWGFSLPIPPLFAAAWTILIVLGWSALV